jgi:endonuclease/exonuclease/phosphatase family metal-dependent hydrolase
MKKILKLLAFAAIAAATCSCGKDNGYVDDGEYDPFGDKNDYNTIDPDDKTEYYPKEEGSLRVMAYNVGAFSKFMQNSTSMVADMILEIKADVVGLNELDSINLRHKVNQVASLAQELGGWKWYFGRAMDYKEGAYGNGVVVPKNVNIIDKYFVTLPKTSKSDSEQRSIAVVETDTYVMAACHMEGNALNQVAVVNSWVEKKYKNYDKPVFFVGDMNAVVGSEHIKTLQEQFKIISSGQNSVPVDSPTKCIDYVFHYKNSKPVEVTGSATMTRFRNGDPTKASDHLPVYADVKF